MSCCFLRSMFTNPEAQINSNITFHVCFLLIIPESPFSLSLQPQPKNVLWEIILGVLEMPRAPQKSKWAAARTIQLAQKLETNSKTYKDRMLTIENSLEANERNMGEIWRNKGKCERSGKPLQERARLNTMLWDFSRGEIILGVLEMPCTSQKTAARTTQLAQRLGKNSKKQKPIKTESLPPRVLWRQMKGIWEKYGEIRENVKG